jgi:hypothetical protein
MQCRRLFLALGCFAVLTGFTHAGFIFGKHTRPNPAERVPQLLVILRTDSEESKRVNAAKELGEFDPKAFPAIIPILIQALKQDPKPSVRLEVVETLAKLRPVSQEAGVALQSALEDASWRVRWQARQSLWSYRLAGYKPPAKPEEAPHPAPPSAKPNTNAVAPGKRGLFTTTPKPGQALVPNETPPPPLADPVPSTPKLVPVPQRPSAPQPAPSETGPDLPIKN